MKPRTDYFTLAVACGLFLVLALAKCAAATAQTTPGTVTLLSTFEAISVRAAYSGDTNANNAATVQFRRTGETSWLDAYAPVIDRRTSVNVQGSLLDNSNNVNQARGSIVGLTPATSYDVLVTWSDPDGVVGTALLTNVVSTLSYVPTASGTNVWVDASAGSEGDGSSGSPYKTITNAIAQSSAGNTLVVRSGTYVPFTISKNGAATNWFTIVTNGGATVKISGGAVANGVLLSANYWKLQGLQVSQAQGAGIEVGSGQHDIFIVNCTQTNAVSATNLSTGAFKLDGSNSNIFVLSNSFTTLNPTITNSNDGLVNNVDIAGDANRTIVVAWNTLTGGWDGIGNRLNSGFAGNGENSDFAHNTISEWVDDQAELDGLGPNVRFFDNHGRKTVAGFNGYGGSLLSVAGVYIEPGYVFRNDMRGTNANVIGWKRGHSSYGVFFFHNTVVSTGTTGNETIDDSGDYTYPSTNQVQRNNIFLASGNVFYHVVGDANNYDYDLGFSSVGADYAGNWNGSNYATLASFRLATGQETHGLGVNPLLNADLTLSPSSSAINSGVTLANFNDVGSAWPSIGGAPDLGAFEINSVPLPPAGLVASAGNATVTLSWSAVSGSWPPASGYKLWRGITSGAETLLLSTNGLSYVDADVTNGVTYWYQVSATNSVGEGLRSVEVTATPAAPTVPTAPQSLTALGGSTFVNLTWVAPASDGGSSVTNYDVLRSTSSGTEVHLAYAGGVTSYRDSAVTAGTTYFYKVTALNAQGASAASGEASAIPTVTVVTVGGKTRVGGKGRLK